MPTPVANTYLDAQGRPIIANPALPPPGAPPALPPPGAPPALPTPVIGAQTGYHPPGTSSGFSPPPPVTAASGGHSTPGAATGGTALNDPKPGGVTPTGAVTPGGPTPVQSPTSPPPSGLLSSPGAYEEWLKANSSKLDTPTRTENLFDGGATSTLDNSPLSGLSTSDSSAGYKAWLANNGSVQGAGNSANVLSGLSTGPSNSTSVYKDASGTLTKPGAAEDVYSKNSTAFNAPGTGEDFYSKYGDEQMQHTATENAFDQYGNGFDDPGSLEAWNAKYGNDPMSKSYTESLYEGGIGQLDPQYDYALKKALEKSRIANSASGEFNSSYANQRDRDVIDNLTGQQAAKWVDLAPIADAAKRARYDQGEKFAGDSQDAYNKRLLNMFDISGQKDKSTLDRFNQGEKFASDSNDQYRQRVLDNFDIAGLNDKATNDRLDTLSSIASRGDSADNATANTRVSAASNADRSANDIYRSAMDANRTGADLEREQGDQNIDLASRQDASNRSNLTTQFNLAGAADASQVGRLLTQGGFAKDLQTTGQNRVIGGLDQTADQGKREADLVNQVYGDTRGIENMDDTQLQALAQKYGVSLEELNSVKSDVKSVVDLLTQAVKKIPL